MNFQEAELRYQALEKKWLAGQLNAEAYRDTLANLRVTDAVGQVWMLQEHTGRWFVFHGGQWVEDQRPPAAAPVNVQPAIHPSLPASDRLPVAERASITGIADDHPAAVHPLAQSKRGGACFGIIFGLLGVGLVCIALGAAGWLVSSGRIPLPPKAGAPGAQPASRVVVKPAETVAVAADGAPHADARGVALTVPSGAVEEGGQLNLSASELDAPWRPAVESSVSIDTPFYSLAAQGKNDTPGTLSLSFPAAHPQSRVLAVIDNEYLVELAQVPQDGKLTLQTRAGPTDTAELKPPAGYDGTGSIYYTVITPKSTSRLPSDDQMVRWRRAAGGPLAKDGLHQADERNCIPDLSIIGGAAINLCRQNPAGTVQVMLPAAKRELLPQVDLMVDKIEAVMNKYNSLGFTTAQLSRGSPMLLRVSTKVTSPSYYPLNGVLYIPVDTVTRIASLSPTDVYHEMAHWIQAVKYSTRLAYWSGEKTWWLETAAENMVMLVEPGYVGGNLTTYGTISNADNTLAFQSTPYQWPGDYYIQAQLLKVNLCDSAACPLSPANFAKAISEGSYPLMNGAMKAQVSANLKDYAFYLLGKPPSAANSAIPLSGPVKTGEGYGEYVRVTRNAGTDLKFDINSAEPQMRKESKDGKDTVAIQANIQQDGVYPLLVLGGQGNNPGLPVELDIAPGAPFYYTVDDGALQYSDGGKELKLLPIHGTMGIKKVRIVALGENGGAVFQARVQPLDLQGAWVVMASGAKTGGAMTCAGGSGTMDNPDGSAQLMAYVMAIASGTGDMQADPTGRSLDWNEVASRVPAQFKEGSLSYKATALLAGDAIKFQAGVDLPKADKQSSMPPLVPAASAAVLLPVLWLGRKRLNLHSARVLTNLLVIAFLALVSTGCFGMGMYGAATLDAKFQKIEYVGGQDTGVLTVSNDASGVPTGQPIWKLTGSGTYDVTFNIEATTTDADGKDTTEVTTCTGKVTFPLVGYIYKDFNVQIPAK